MMMSHFLYLVFIIIIISILLQCIRTATTRQNMVKVVSHIFQMMPGWHFSHDVWIDVGSLYHQHNNFILCCYEKYTFICLDKSWHKNLRWYDGKVKFMSRVWCMVKILCLFTKKDFRKTSQVNNLSHVNISKLF